MGYEAWFVTSLYDRLRREVPKHGRSGGNRWAVKRLAYACARDVSDGVGWGGLTL